MSVRTIILAAMLLAPLLFTPSLQAQDVAGDWQGTLGAPPNALRLVVHLVKAQDGTYLGQLDSLDQGSRIAIDTVRVTGSSVRLELKSVNGTFEGALEADGTLKGTWSQGVPLPLVLTRVSQANTAAAATNPAVPDIRLDAVLKNFGVPMDVGVPIPPMAVRGHGGAMNLAYEIHLTNASPVELHVSRIEVLNGDGGAALEAFEGSALNAILQVVGQGTGQGVGTDAPDHRTIPRGMRGVAFLWVRLNPGVAVPKSLRNRITVDGVSIENTVTVSGDPIVLGPPLRGSAWLAANGPGNATGHRRAMMPIEGKLQIGQRFAIDWVKVDQNGRTFDGDAKDNKKYFAYGADAIAVMDAPVVSVKDGIPENVPGPDSRAVPITLDTIGGNSVVLDLGGGRYAFYAHLQPGSIKVKPGDKVKRGQVLGLVGNSGNSTEPHLHFHVSNGPSPLGSEGLPYVMESFEVLGATAAGAKTNALPMANAVVKFPEGQ